MRVPKNSLPSLLEPCYTRLQVQALAIQVLHQYLESVSLPGELTVQLHKSTVSEVFKIRP